MYWAAGSLDDTIVTPPQLPEGVEEGSEEAERLACAATFADQPAVLACLEATPAGRMYTSRVLDRAPLPPSGVNWTGPVTLAGDAAHPVVRRCRLTSC